MKRKDFIYRASLLGGSLVMGCGSTLIRSKKEVESINFDLHAHPGVFILKGTPEYAGDDQFISRVNEMSTAGISGAFFSLVADLPLLKRTENGIVPNGKFSNEEGWNEFQRQLGQLKELLKNVPLDFSIDPTDMINSKNVKALIACEGGDFLDGNINRVKEAYDLGVRSIQLVHYAPNILGDLQTWKAEHNGLSQFGKSVVSEMNNLGMLIDVAHASIKTVKDVVDQSNDPVILSHSILNDDENRPISARAISKEHALMITKNGGLIGMWPSGFSTSFDEFVDHTIRMIDVVGIDHVGIGTDMDANFKPVISNYIQFNSWKKALIHKGLSIEEVGLLAGGNAYKLLKSVLKTS